MKKKFTSVFISAILMLQCVAFIYAQAVIVETRPEGKNVQCYKESGAGWSDSVAKSLVDGVTPGIGSRFLPTDVVPSSETFFEITPSIPSAGKYQIDITFGTSGNAENCVYKLIINKVEVKKVSINQRGWGNTEQGDAGNANAWISLGTFDLPQGTSATLIGSPSEITGKASSINSGRFYADAVRFAPVQADGSVLADSGSAAKPAAGQPPAGNQSSPFTSVNQQTGVSASSGANQPVPTQSSLTGSPFQQTQSTSSPNTPNQQSASALNWLFSYTEAIQQAKTQNKPVLMFFYSEMGRLSNNMEKQVLESSQIKQNLDKYILCKIKITDSANNRLSEYYQVFKAPTIIFLDSKGWMRDREDKTVDIQGMSTILQKNSTP